MVQPTDTRGSGLDRGVKLEMGRKNKVLGPLRSAEPIQQVLLPPVNTRVRVKKDFDLRSRNATFSFHSWATGAVNGGNL